MVDLSKLNENFNMEYKLSSGNQYRELAGTTNKVYSAFRDWVNLLGPMQ